MSEHVPTSPEVSPENHVENKASEQHNTQPTASVAEKQPADQLEAIRQSVEAANEHSPIEAGTSTTETPAPPKPTYVNKELKSAALRRSLQHIQHDLPAGKRLLSKVIHQPVVRRVSAATGQTVARPSGVLGGGICAFLGTLLYLYLAKHLGFTYNYLLFILFFIGGFAVGLVIEFVLRGLAHWRSKK